MEHSTTWVGNYIQMCGLLQQKNPSGLSANFTRKPGAVADSCDEHIGLQYSLVLWMAASSGRSITASEHEEID